VPEAVLGLGSNLGARRALLRCALALLEAQPGLTLLARSPLYETEPVGPPQPHYLNAAVRVAWVGSAESLFVVTQQVEHTLGRVRAERWGARTLDIDFLYWSSGSLKLPGLHVPHAELLARNFALAPLLDVMPELSSTWGATLARLGGSPERARPGWLDAAHALDAEGLELLHASESGAAELACLAVSAVGRCARRGRRARASMSFTRPEDMQAAGAKALLEHAESASQRGFCVCDAAITGVDARGTHGILIGEHTGGGERVELMRPE
jgi:2-amino-4-hydroxy-6-hydroxymethyldihydropteridine diphosphokinase